MDIIIGMDWMNQFEALIDYRQMLVRVRTPSGGELSIKCEGCKSCSTFCSNSRAKRYLQHGCEGFPAYVIDTREKKKETIKEVLVVCGFHVPGFFPEDLPGVPPEGQVELRIDLILFAAPIAKTPYHLTPLEM